MPNEREKPRVRPQFRGARAPRTLAMAPRHRELSLRITSTGRSGLREAHKPAGDAPALPKAVATPIR